MISERSEAAGFSSWHVRKLLQATPLPSSSSFDPSQASFIALICVTGVLSIAIVVMIIILCCRYDSYRKKKAKKPKKYPQIFTYPENAPATHPASVTPSSASPHTIRSDERLLSNRSRPPLQPGSTVSTTPSRRHQGSTMEAYLNDQNIYEPIVLDPQQLNSFLFIDLHSTSSETFPESYSRQMLRQHPPMNNNTTTSGYHTSMGDEHAAKMRQPNGLPYRSWRRSSLANVKSSQNARFLVRERSLATHLPHLPQLRRSTVPIENGRDPNDSSLTTNHPDLLSTDLSITTDDYDESHAYHVQQQQQQMMKTIDEEQVSPTITRRPRSPHPIEMMYQGGEQHVFEIVSTYRGDDSDQPVVPRNSSGPAFLNRSILV